MEKIISFEIVTLRESGMRGAHEYEILPTGRGAAVSLYGMRYENGEETRVLDSRAECEKETVIDLLNGCRVVSWDGFDGPHPRGVLDGIIFSFEAVVNDGRRIKARGSQNFPRRYRDFTDGLYGILADSR